MDLIGNIVLVILVSAIIGMLLGLAVVIIKKEGL